MSDRLDCVVVGGGVVGLACLRALARAGLNVALCERERRIGQGISSRSSEVIHAGLHYPAGSLKARLCVDGARQLYDYCAQHGVAHRRTGKLVVAPSGEEVARLDAMLRRAHENGATNCRLISGAEARTMEPELRCEAALWSPDTGIVDSHALMQAFAAEAESCGAMLVLDAPVSGARRSGGGFELAVGGATPYRVETRWIVDAAGLGAQALAAEIEGFPAAAIPPLHLAKGHYFSLQGRTPFSHLIYPVPEPGGLGIHLTLDLAGQARFGPDVAWIDTPDYSVPESRAAAFLDAIRRYWPSLEPGRLAPAYAGIRPKCVGPGEADADFRIDTPDRHGMAGVIALFGIESPGLTASLAIAEQVATAVCG